MGIQIANDLIFKQVDTIDAFDISTGDYLFSLEELTNYTISHTEDSKDVIGRNRQVISRIKSSKGVTISGTNGVVSAGLFSAQTGGEYEVGSHEIMWNEHVIVNNNTATLSYDAVGTVGAEIVSLLIYNKQHGTLVKLEQGLTASDGVFTYNPSNKTLAFESVDDGTEVIVYYNRYLRTTSMTNYATKYSRRVMMYVNGFAEDRCANVYRVQFFFPKVDLSGEFSFEVGNGQTMHNFEAVALCSICGGTPRYYTYNVFGEYEDDSYEPGTYVYIGTDNKYYVGTDNKVYTYKVQ